MTVIYHLDTLANSIYYSWLNALQWKYPYCSSFIKFILPVFQTLNHVCIILVYHIEFCPKWSHTNHLFRISTCTYFYICINIPLVCFSFILSDLFIYLFRFYITKIRDIAIAFEMVYFVVCPHQKHIFYSEEAHSHCRYVSFMCENMIPLCYHCWII